MKDKMHKNTRDTPKLVETALERMQVHKYYAKTHFFYLHKEQITSLHVVLMRDKIKHVLSWNEETMVAFTADLHLISENAVTSTSPFLRWFLELRSDQEHLLKTQGKR